MKKELLTIVSLIILFTFFVTDILFLIFEPDAKGFDIMIAQVLVCIFMYIVTFICAKER